MFITRSSCGLKGDVSVLYSLRPPPYHPGLPRKGRIYVLAPARWEDSRAIEPYRILEAGASLGLPERPERIAIHEVEEPCSFVCSCGCSYQLRLKRRVGRNALSTMIPLGQVAEREYCCLELGRLAATILSSSHRKLKLTSSFTIQATPRAGTLERDGVVERQVAPVGERV